MEKPGIGLLGLTLNLYKEKRPQLIPQLEEFYNALSSILAKKINIIEFPIAYSKETVSEAFMKSEKLEASGIILVFLSYAPSLSILPAAKKTSLPILIWNTQKIETITEDFSPKDSFSNHGMHGVQDLTCVLRRENVPFSLLTGHFKNKKVLCNLYDWCEAATAASSMKRTKIGRIGGTFSQMGDFSMKTDVLKSAIGVQTEEIGKSDVKSYGDTPSPSKRETEEFLGFKPVYEKDVSDKYLIDAFKSYEFLKLLSKKYGLSGWAINFQGLNKDMPMPFLALSKLMNEGFGYGGEGDIFSASAVRLAQILTGNKATFTEMFTTDYKKSRIYMTHMGESNIGLRRKKEAVRLVLNKMELGNEKPSIVPVFSIEPGVYTLLNLTWSAETGLKVICSRSEVIDMPPLKNMKTPHFILSPEKIRVEDFLDRFSHEGGTHHLALASGDIINKLKFFCFINSIKCIDIGGGADDSVI